MKARLAPSAGTAYTFSDIALILPGSASCCPYYRHARPMSNHPFGRSRLAPSFHFSWEREILSLPAHEAGLLPLPVALGGVLALVVQLLALRQRQLQLGPPPR